MTAEELTESGGSELETAKETPAGIVLRSHEDIQQWLTEYLAFLLEEKPEAIDVKLTFDSYGIDSAAAVSLVADLEDWMGLELDPTIVYDYPTVAELSDFLIGRQDDGAA